MRSQDGSAVLRYVRSVFGLLFRLALIGGVLLFIGGLYASRTPNPLFEGMSPITTSAESAASFDRKLAQVLERRIGTAPGGDIEVAVSETEISSKLTALMGGRFGPGEGVQVHVTQGAIRSLHRIAFGPLAVDAGAVVRPEVVDGEVRFLVEKVLVGQHDVSGLLSREIASSLSGVMRPLSVLFPGAVGSVTCDGGLLTLRGR